MKSFPTARQQFLVFIGLNGWLLFVLVFPTYVFSHPSIYWLFDPNIHYWTLLWWTPIESLFIFANVWMSLRIGFRHPVFLACAALHFDAGSEWAMSNLSRIYGDPSFAIPLERFPDIGFIIW